MMAEIKKVATRDSRMRPLSNGRREFLEFVKEPLWIVSHRMKYDTTNGGWLFL